MLKPTSRILILILIILTLASSPVCCLSSSPVQYRDYWPTTGWRSLSPEAQGVNSTKLEELWQHMLAEANAGGFLLIRNGYLLYEAYYPGISADHLWNLVSVAKSITAAVLGVALADGYVSSVNDFVLDYFPDRTVANPDPRKDAMTIHHLLTMSAGFESQLEGIVLPSDWIQYLLDLPMLHDPGEVWNFDGGCSHLISAIITHTTGISMQTFAQTRIFTPMGISNYVWEADPEGNTMGFGHITMGLKDIAKFAYLYLNNGTWGPFQLVPADWVTECTQPHFLFSDGTGYGYQWWVDPEISGYSMRGTGGIRIFNLPELDLVMVFAGGMIFSIQDFYSAFDEFLYPAIIGDTVSITQPVGEQIFPFVVVLLLVAIPVVVGNVYRQRKRF
ncbi:MAG: serine hydrolase domain-containing protein [Candidatus Hermodarchaeota archaeon]